MGTNNEATHALGLIALRGRRKSHSPKAKRSSSNRRYPRAARQSPIHSFEIERILAILSGLDRAPPIDVRWCGRAGFSRILTEWTNFVEVFWLVCEGGSHTHITPQKIVSRFSRCLANHRISISFAVYSLAGYPRHQNNKSTIDIIFEPATMQYFAKFLLLLFF